MPGVLEGAECYKRSFQFRRAPGMDGMGVWQVATRPLCVRMASNFYQGAKEGKSPRRALHKCTVKCILLQKGAVNYCGCISRIEGAYIRIVGASAPTKRYKITPLRENDPRTLFETSKSVKNKIRKITVKSRNDLKTVKSARFLHVSCIGRPLYLHLDLQLCRSSI